MNCHAPFRDDDEMLPATPRDRGMPMALFVERLLLVAGVACIVAGLVLAALRGSL